MPKKDPKSYMPGVEAAAAKKRAQTHCKRGHPLFGDNVKFKIVKNGCIKRVCRTCKSDRNWYHNRGIPFPKDDINPF